MNDTTLYPCAPDYGDRFDKMFDEYADRTDLDNWAYRARHFAFFVCVAVCGALAARFWMLAAATFTSPLGG